MTRRPDKNVSNQMEKIKVAKNAAGRRIDKFLAREFFSSTTRAEIVRDLKAGRILVNKKAVKSGYFLRELDEIEINFDFQKNLLAANPNVPIKIIFKDPQIIVIDKPAGIQVHPDAHEKEKTLVNGLVALFPEIKNVHDKTPGAEFRPGIVHRLDKNTSGVMVVARTAEILAELKRMFQEREVKKIYTALVHGKLKKSKDEIRKPIARSENYRKQTIAGKKTRTKIRPAITRYRVLHEFAKYSIVEAVPKTGRMHQIRVHFSSLGNPVVGDALYCPRYLKRERIVLPRHLLHAQKISFRLFGERFSFSSPLPADFSNFLQNID